MSQRRRFKQHLPLQDRLAEWAKEVLSMAQVFPLGPERDALIRKARQADIANHLDDWAKSPGLQPPR
ncbi:hypothetical protein G6321_00024080 [Bradyrhizobium barranii subsp. barranii]|uniref:Uncharacterized protein n=2 Tax=Bradyrhizobium TaxID=374 RepID=A0A9X9Z4D4_9BRAD|nr:hypothetical protein [Bradyrhizobium japonicum]OSJ35164.1 hypothetical protein BSZ19_09690 [Bradyrhizobium japonicum]UGX98039.1 hypothetical protein G6321_00024080 [Bradyrhizobium barranii subsp. barranii]